MITHKQLTLADVFEDCQNKFDNDKYQFLSLLDEAIDLDEIVPVSEFPRSRFCFQIFIECLSGNMKCSAIKRNFTLDPAVIRFDCNKH